MLRFMSGFPFSSSFGFDPVLCIRPNGVKDQGQMTSLVGGEMATLLSGNLTDELTGQRAVAGGIFTPSWVLRNARGFARSSDLTGSSQLPGAVVLLLSLPTREGQDQRGCVRAI
jgi:hypothetical protein